MFAIRRSIGIAEFLHGQAEIVLITLFALLTQLGDVWFLFALGGGLYVAGSRIPQWRIGRRRGLFVFALAVGYVVLINVLKPLFNLPRPVGASVPPVVQWLPPVLSATFADITTGTGPGFPSGHALGSTMVWGGFALVLDGVRDRVRFGLAASVVSVVAISRLVLGVHYAVDVVVGAGLGLVVLGACYWLADGGSQPGRVLLAAFVVGVVGLVVDGSAENPAAVGAAAGAWLVWRGVADTLPDHATTGREAIVAVAVLAIVGAFSGLVYAFDPSAPLVFAGAAVAGGGVVGAPLLGARLA